MMKRTPRREESKVKTIVVLFYKQRISDQMVSCHNPCYHIIYKMTDLGS